MQELAAAVQAPGAVAPFVEVPAGSGRYQPCVPPAAQEDADGPATFWALGVVVAKALEAGTYFPLRFSRCA